MARLTELTPALIDQIVARIRAGSYALVAARSCGVASSTWYGWLKRGRAGEAPYSELVDVVEKAHGDAEVKHVALVAKAAEKTWQAAAWWLERHYPERWASDRNLKRHQAEQTRLRNVGALPAAQIDVRSITAVDLTDPDAVRARLAEIDRELAAGAIAPAGDDPAPPDPED